MAWQRTIPFGYRMEQGEIQCCPTESAAVREMFRLYADGVAYSAIAEEMMYRGIRYHAHTPEWNKHMVKRILENQRYLGEKEYPKIIESDVFMSVQIAKGDRNTYAPSPGYIQPIRDKAICGVCGGRMLRDTRMAGKVRWYCENEDCRNRHYIEDADTRTALAQRLIALAGAPHLLDWPCPQRAEETTLEAARIQQEIIRELNKAEPGAEYTKMLILACAAEKYSVLPDHTPQYKMGLLREKVSSQPIDERLCDEIFVTAVQNVIFTAEGGIALRLTNGKEC